MSTKEEKKYNQLLMERQGLLDEAERWKRGLLVPNKRLGLWACSTYIDELLYVRQGIEKEITQYEITFRVHFYKNIRNILPEDTIYHIVSFGDIIDKTAFNLLK